MMPDNADGVKKTGVVTRVRVTVLQSAAEPRWSPVRQQQPQLEVQQTDQCPSLVLSKPDSVGVTTVLLWMAQDLINPSRRRLTLERNNAFPRRESGIFYPQEHTQFRNMVSKRGQLTTLRLSYRGVVVVNRFFHNLPFRFEIHNHSQLPAEIIPLCFCQRRPVMILFAYCAGGISFVCLGNWDRIYRLGFGRAAAPARPAGCRNRQPFFN
jgi:hypothetical protein